MDQKLYQRTFDQAHMSAERTAEIRQMLAGRGADHDREVSTMMKSRKKTAAVLAVCAVLALSVTAFASGGGLTHVFQMLSGPAIQLAPSADGNYYFEGEREEEPVSPVELREDGRLYLTVNGENRDITDECSYETPYVYTCAGEDGLQHTFIIGGEPESIGWIEYAGDEDEDFAVGGTVVEIPGDTPLKNLPWLNEGLEQTTGVRLETLPFTVSDCDPYEVVSEDGGRIERIITFSAGQEPDEDVPLYDADGNVIGVSSQVSTVTITVNPE
ncbi:MAG: hypothetical protein K2O18_12835 [Oscillospiraceae bacterium]|nr:hypothetical protein [Oscillospiraceae bacterium]